jgi:RNA recognition motif-containing protein
MTEAEESESCVYLQPICKNFDMIAKAFADAGFGDFLKIATFPEYCFVEFKTIDRAMQFINAMNGSIRYGKKISASLTHRTNKLPNYWLHEVPIFENPISKTLVVEKPWGRKNSERDLFDLFKDKGFVRAVAIINGRGFVEFDSVSEAENAFEKSKNLFFEGTRLLIYPTEDKHLDAFQLGAQIMTQIKKGSSPSSLVQ